MESEYFAALYGQSEFRTADRIRKVGNFHLNMMAIASLSS